ncbi:MAG: isocitrate/isopropylmalate family dehydrogenase, partial [Deltaproteobacteria bacterium]|nr:isocitrate/isopropylmalate family dehydrogenase [Deltaproteobacteria bacterium]
EPVSTNPIASIFAWSQGLFYRGKFDGNSALMERATKLEDAVKQTVESGHYTKDLAVLIEGEGTKNYLTTQDFIKSVRRRLEECL